MKNIVDRSDIIPFQRPGDVIGDKHKMFVIAKFLKPLFCLLFIAPKCVHGAIQAALQVLMQQHVDKEAADQAGGAGNQKAVVLQLFPGKRQFSYPVDIFQIFLVLIQLHTFSSFPISASYPYRISDML